MTGTRYVERDGLWVPAYTEGAGLGTKIAKLAYRLGFKQKAGCGCPKRQAMLDRWTGAGVEPPMYRGNALPIIAGGTGGDEARCTELGSNCICSSQLNAASWQWGPNPGWYTPSDSGSKPCNNDLLGGVLYDGAGTQFALGQHTPTNSGAIWNALPAGHSLSWVLKQNDESNGNSLAHRFAGGDPSARRAMRFYRWYSSDSAFTSPETPLCNSGKVIQIGAVGTFTGGPVIQIGIEDRVAYYDIQTAYHWTQTQQPNCCMPAPGGPTTYPSTTTGVNKADLRGNWMRYEFAMGNTAPGGSSTYWEMWAKDVTNNLAEVKIMDTRVEMTDGRTSDFWWQSPMTDNLHVESGFNMQDFAVNMFRSNNGDVCTGSIGHSSLMMAAWSTDSGQRIGAALEIESSGGVVAPHRIYSLGRRSGF